MVSFLTHSFLCKRAVRIIYTPLPAVRRMLASRFSHLRRLQSAHTRAAGSRVSGAALGQAATLASHPAWRPHGRSLARRVTVDDRLYALGKRQTILKRIRRVRR